MDRIVVICAITGILFGILSILFDVINKEELESWCFNIALSSIIIEVIIIMVIASSK